MRMKKRIYRHKRPLVIARCKRCGENFEFVRVTKNRFYCQPCLAMEIKDARDLSRLKRQMRQSEEDMQCRGLHPRF